MVQHGLGPYLPDIAWYLLIMPWGLRLIKSLFIVRGFAMGKLWYAVLLSIIMKKWPIAALRCFQSRTCSYVEVPITQ